MSEIDEIDARILEMLGEDGRKSFTEIAQKLCDFKEIKCVATSTGDHMIMTEIWTKNGKGLTKIISEKIAAIEGVEKICPAIILEKLKE